MPFTAKLFLLSGGFAAFLAVMLGAFGAHALKKLLTPDMMTIYETAVQYHFYHALGLLAVGLLMLHLPTSVWLKWSGWLMLIGIVVFSGSLYALAISSQRWLGAITPIGGTAFIAAWLVMLIGLFKAS
jgi:uncharacterized membrane protein YgdD (TMEM256/DUF423 family)